ncbi:YwpF family protein [Aquibacillus rhizosphaerae]|uniref:YwpF family protein n=1 Tax=Aquibacillus rhizosphaerae TaxID=3051431 RepID=A0ABT7L8I1_9BACI|nr:YwpF family protein [Aquibacillus sp. LR5S19]MDL4842173.1 YwpF family protein [Aquibacillus sp. LR5S19]
MKTFKLISLDVLEKENNKVVAHSVPLLDGLIIDREDEKNQWVIEFLLNYSELDYFLELKNKNESILLRVKITKESNSPATFLSTFIEINDMGKHINVLLLSELFNKNKGMVETALKDLIEEGYEGDELLNKFKKRV